MSTERDDGPSVSTLCTSVHICGHATHARRSELLSQATGLSGSNISPQAPEFASLPFLCWGSNIPWILPSRAKRRAGRPRPPLEVSLVELRQLSTVLCATSNYSPGRGNGAVESLNKFSQAQFQSASEAAGKRTKEAAGNVPSEGKTYEIAAQARTPQIIQRLSSLSGSRVLGQFDRLHAERRARWCKDTPKTRSKDRSTCPLG